MNRDITLWLKTAHIQASSEGNGSDPYLWTSIVLVGPAGVECIRISPPRLLLGRNVHPVAQREVPPAIGWWHRLLSGPDHAALQAVLLVVSALDHDSTPTNAINAGSAAYDLALRTQLTLRTLLQLSQAEDDATRAAIIARIDGAVSTAVRSAIANAEGIGGAITDNDDPIGFAYQLFRRGGRGTFAAAQFNLALEGNGGDRLQLTGELRDLPQPVDLCASQKRRHGEAGRLLSNEVGLLHALQQQLHHASPQDKPALLRQIGAQHLAIESAQAAYAEATAALKACHDRFAGGGPFDDHHGGGLPPQA